MAIVIQIIVYLDHMLVDQFCLIWLHGYIQGHLSEVCWSSCPCYMIIDSNKNFVSVEAQVINANWGLEWHTNLQLASWHSGFSRDL